MIIDMKKGVKIVVGAVLALIAVTGYILSANAPLPVMAHTLAAQTATVTVTEEGRYTYEKTADVHPLLEGEVVEVLVQKGDRVAQGDAIAVVSATDMDFQIRQMESGIAGYNAQIQNLALQDEAEKDTLLGTRSELEGQLTTLQAQMEDRENSAETREHQIMLQEQIVDQNRENVHLARQDRADAKESHNDGDLTDTEYSEYRQTLITAQNALTESQKVLLDLQNGGDIPDGYYEGQLESLKAQIEFIDSRVKKNYSTAMQAYYSAQIQSTQVGIQQLRAQQGRATITAPCDGYVSELPVESSNLVTRETVVATIGQTPVVEVFVPVREMDGIAQGDTVDLIVDKRAGEQRSRGRVIFVESEAQVGLSALGVEESTVRVLVEPMGDSLKIGYQLDVEFLVYRQEDCISVPKQAVFQQDGQDSVWVVQDSVAVVQPVTKGAETREGYVIEAGLSAGDVVIAEANTQGVAQGSRVAV